jgi:hypothetical protein
VPERATSFAVSAISSYVDDACPVGRYRDIALVGINSQRRPAGRRNFHANDGRRRRVPWEPRNPSCDTEAGGNRRTGGIELAREHAAQLGRVAQVVVVAGSGIGQAVHQELVEIEPDTDGGQHVLAARRAPRPAHQAFVAGVALIGEADGVYRARLADNFSYVGKQFVGAWFEGRITDFGHDRTVAGP